MAGLEHEDDCQLCVSKGLLFILARELRASWAQGRPRVSQPLWSLEHLPSQLCAWAHGGFSEESVDYSHTMDSACLL